LEEAIKGNIEEIVITNKDRLCRFGFELFESIITTNNGSIMVLYDEDKSPNEELVEDVLSIITVFSAKLYGRRSHRNKRV
jgi:predicted site-specific integrase-resolvase